MTSRLKRRLNDIGVDPSSSKANESFCLIGTPLPPLEKSRDTGEFVPLWKQEVRDEKGRRRLHGAFTGGFSAGYFNTVGSKEGWTPREFVSSRSSRAKNKTARPEDFMDEEDLQDAKDSRKLVDENEKMDLGPGTSLGTQPDESDSVARALEAALSSTPNDSAGARILKKMGWKPGQGIGPRLNWKQRRKQDLNVPGAMELAPEDDEEANKHTYAPRDPGIISVGQKSDSHGLGWTRGATLQESLGRAKAKEEQKGPKISAGFGLGALNDADDDDLDVYEGISAYDSSRGRMAYDRMDDEENDQIFINSRKRVSTSKQSAEVSSFFLRDGRAVLAGFVLSNAPVSEDQWFPLPDIPKGWRPDPKSVWSAHEDKENRGVKRVDNPTKPVSHAQWKAGISADERGSLLGETPLPAAPRSVFEYLSKKDRDRIQNIGDNLSSQPTPSPPSPDIPRTEAHTAQAALRGFQPFEKDPVKHARYTAYLMSQASPEDSKQLQPSPGQSREDFAKEMSDYEKSAQLFKPMSGAMAGRFTSAAVVEQGPKIIEGLHQPSVSSSSKPGESSTDTSAEPVQEETPKAHAARLGMYGAMTREVEPWAPAKLLCKRFGVKEPEPDPLLEPTLPSTSSAPSATTLSAAEEQLLTVPDGSSRSAFEGNQESSGSGGGGKRDLNNVGLGEDDTQGQDTLTYERPAMDIFKAIFASDDEDSDAEDNSKEDDAPSLDRTVPMPQPPGNNANQDTVTSVPAPSSSAPAPAESEPRPANEEKVDLATFKPMFVPRGERSTIKASDSSSKKEKKDKKRRKSDKVLVSFGGEDEDGEDGVSKSKDSEKPKKKKHKSDKHHRDKDKPKNDAAMEDDDMWVEKPPPEAVKSLDVDRPQESAGPRWEREETSSTTRSRTRAIDFM